MSTENPKREGGCTHLEEWSQLIENGPLSISGLETTKANTRGFVELSLDNHTIKRRAQMPPTS